MKSLASIVSAFSMRAVLSFAIAASVASAPAPAAAQGLSTVRDAEIEALVRDYTKPLLQAAGLGTQKIDIILVNDPSFNAFVSGRRIFVNTGMLMQSETPNETIGVLAHEIGHLAGRHQERLRQQLENAKTMQIVGMLLGAGVAAAGAATKNGSLTGAGAAAAGSASEVARRSILSYQRTEETTADRSALRYLEATGQSAKGLLTTFKRFQSALSLSGTRIDPYQISHPTPRDRVANLEIQARKSPYFDVKDPPALQKRHDRMRAKIAAFTRDGSLPNRLFTKKGDDVEAKQYGDAIEGYLRGDPRRALPKIDAMIKQEPNNPYYYELRGDLQMKMNRPNEAVAAYQKAIKLDPARSGMLQISLGQAYLAQNNPKSTKLAITALQKGLSADSTNAAGYRYLSQAYGQSGEIPLAELAAAEGYFNSNSFQNAKIFAARAQRKLPPRSPEWMRAQDIINFKAPKN